MALQYWNDCLQAARDFAGDSAGDFVIEALASELFDWCPNQTPTLSESTQTPRFKRAT
nr:MAG TPA: hypothetical protein [Caudoviricetes sp.]